MTIRKLKRSTWAKIIIGAIVVLLLSLSPLYAEYEKPIGENDLPVNALTFLQEHFPNDKVAFAKVDNDYFCRSYEVILSSGAKVGFRRNGEWASVETKYNHTIPPGIVPQQINEYLQTHFPNTVITEISRDRKEYEVELSNSLELTFDSKSFFLTDYDD